MQIRDQVEDVRAAASAKAWQMDIYRQTCEEYMKTVEMDFVEAIVDGMEEGKTELDEFLCVVSLAEIPPSPFC